MRRYALCCTVMLLILLALPAQVRAEPGTVSGRLKITVYTKPMIGTRVVAVLADGSPVEVLQIQGEWALIRTQEEVEGYVFTQWVKFSGDVRGSQGIIPQEVKRVIDVPPESVLGGTMAGNAVLSAEEEQLWIFALESCGCEPQQRPEAMFGVTLPFADIRCSGGQPAAPEEVDKGLSSRMIEYEKSTPGLIERLWRRAIFRQQLLLSVPAHRQIDPMDLDDALLLANRTVKADIYCARALDAANRFRTSETIRAFGIVRTGLDIPVPVRSSADENSPIAATLTGGERIELRGLDGFKILGRLGRTKVAVDPRLFQDVVVEHEKKGE